MTTLYHKTESERRLSADNSPVLSVNYFKDSLVIPGEFNLTAGDSRALAASFISLEYQRAFFRRVSGGIGGAVVGQQHTATRSMEGLAIALFYDAAATRPNEFELRRDFPDEDGEDADGNPKYKAKYLRPSRGVQLCFAPGIFAEYYKDVLIPILLVEGIKKLLAALRVIMPYLMHGEKPPFIPIAVSGVWNWRGTIGKTQGGSGQRMDVKDILSGFQQIELKLRPFYILFDNDTHTNPHVKIARQRCGEAISERFGAVVYEVDLPKSEKKIGLDDWLGKLEAEHGEDGARQKMLELLETKRRFTGEIQARVSDSLTLYVTAGERGKCKVTARNEAGEAIAIDTFSLTEADKRNKFIKQIEADLTLTADERTQAQRELLRFAEVSDVLLDSDTPGAVTVGETVETSFHVLSDGRVIEQIRGGFAVYNPDTNEHCITDSATDTDGTIYAPIDDELFQKSGGVSLADELTEYGSEVELVSEIETYLSKYLDLKPLQLKLTALYILFTYIFDSVLELSYLNATGDAGSGKSRFGQTVCLASRRGLALITPSAASLYRIVDKFKPTLFLDEFNSDANSDDAAAIIQILNAGYQKTAQIPRMVATADGKFKTELFDAFCPKIVGSLKQSASNAFNSRCIEIQMERTTRNDIPLRLSHNLLNDARRLRNKLTLWRLRNIQTDFEARLDRAENELRQSGIMPRSIQINIPLYALIKDGELKRDFIQLLKGRDENLHEEKQQTFDGQLVKAFHVCLFEIDDADHAEWKREIQPRPEEMKPCEHLRIEKITAILNAEIKKEKDHFETRYIGKRIHALGLKSKQIKVRSSDYYNASAVLFDSHRLALIFRNFGLPVPADFSLDQLDQSKNLNLSNDLTRSKENESNGAGVISLDQLKSNDFNTNGGRSNWSKEISGNGGRNGNGSKKITVDEVV